MNFETVSIAPIRKDDRYGGFCVRLNAVYDTIVTPLSIDVSTGGVITPSAVQYEFGGIFDDNVRIKLWGYHIETVMAEKVEAEKMIVISSLDIRQDKIDRLFTANRKSSGGGRTVRDCCTGGF